MPSRNFSRSCGVLCSQRSLIRPRQRRCRPGPPRNPPKRSRARISSPRPCPKLIDRHPNRSGISRFHKVITTKPSTVTATAANSRNRSPLPIQCLLILRSSSTRELVMDRLEAPAQVDDRVMLAREEGVHAHAGFRGHLLEAAPLQLVGDERDTLFLGKLVEGRRQLQ